MAPILIQEKRIIKDIKRFFFLNPIEKSVFFKPNYISDIQKITKKFNINEIKIDKNFLRRKFELPLLLDTRPTFSVKLGKRFVYFNIIFNFFIL
jgi:hypothetical protein